MKTFRPSYLIALVQHIGLVLKGHGVAESRTPATHHRDAQAGGYRILGRHDLFYFPNRLFGQLHHALYTPDSELAVPLYKRAAQLGDFIVCDDGDTVQVAGKWT